MFTASRIDKYLSQRREDAKKIQFNYFFFVFFVPFVVKSSSLRLRAFA
jgi:hypothetical protein